MSATTQRYDTDYYTRHSDGLKLCIELIRCSNKLDRIIDKNLRQQFGQSISRFDLLAQLYREGENSLTVGELGQRLISAKGNITGLINRMIKDGLVTKTANKDDRRSYRVNISEKGLALFKEMADNHGKWVYNLFGSIDLESMHHMTEMLAAIRSTLSLKQKLPNRLE